MLIGVFTLLISKKIPLSFNALFYLVAGFFLSCLISSVNYVVNEILDSPYDSLHPAKRFAEIRMLSHHIAIPYRKTYRHYTEKASSQRLSYTLS
jgi:hypothetical protein